MQGISLLLERAQAEPSLLLSLLSSLLHSTTTKIQSSHLGLQYTIPSEGSSLAAVPDPEQVAVPCCGESCWRSAIPWGKLPGAFSRWLQEKKPFSHAFPYIHCLYSHLSSESMYMHLSVFICLFSGKGQQDIRAYFSFCCLLPSQVSCFPNSLSSHSPFFPRNGGRWWSNGKMGRKEHCQRNDAVRAQSKGAWVSVWVSAATFLHLVPVSHMALSWSIFSNFQNFLEKQKTTTLTPQQRQHPMEADGCPTNFPEQCKHLSGSCLPLEMLWPPLHG